MKYEGPWRVPDEESVDLYPGLTVHDGRVSGSITVGQSRLPLWAFSGWMLENGWDEVIKGWPYIEGPGYEWTAEKMSEFIHYLTEMRGEFGRLLLVLADAERLEEKRNSFGKAWWQTKKHRKRVRAQLVRCIEALDSEETNG